VIADHIRTLSFAIADGIQPSNEGRGYVLRRILRRAVRYGRTLGFHEPFFYKLVDVLVATMSGVFPEVGTKQQLVRDTLRREEEAFNKTLDKGIALFETEAANVAGTISGAFAFRLYDEQGFPLDLTELMARERGLTVDVAGFDALMEQQRARARAAQKKETISVSDAETFGRTAFVGYEQPEATARVLESLTLKDKVGVVLDTTACYAEMGGQVGDTGELAQNGSRWRVANTQKAGNATVHVIAEGAPPEAGAEVQVRVDVPRRRAIERHHTGHAPAALGVARNRVTRRGAEGELRRAGEADVRFQQRRAYAGASARGREAGERADR
jgi:alanyl-tRNA synthetase